MNLQISYDLKMAKQNMAKIENEIIPLQAITAWKCLNCSTAWGWSSIWWSAERG